MKNIDFLRENSLRDTVITDISVSDWTEGEKNIYSVRFEGDLPHTGEYRYYDLWFTRIQAKASEEDARLKTHLQTLKTLKKPTLKDIKIVKAQDGYDVAVVLTEEGREFCISFFCDGFSPYRWHYRGMDYTNVYGTQEYMDMAEKYSYIFNEEYFEDEEVTELPDGYSLCQRTYIHQSERARYGVMKCELRKDGKCIYAYNSTDDHFNPYKDFICHSNGHRYYPFHIDLYGISYIDVDTLEVYHYVPRGYDNDHGALCGESFIITGVHYDPKTNLVAYEGCYWACPNDVMVGSLNNPLNFDPHLISVYDIWHAKYGGGHNVDFVSWEEDGLSVKLHDEKTVKISMDELKLEMEKQRGDT